MPGYGRRSAFVTYPNDFQITFQSEYDHETFFNRTSNSSSVQWSCAGARLPACPWELVTGKWQLSYDTGYSSTVVWKKTDGNAVIGHWEDAHGKATELVGWRPDKKELAAIGFGPKGTYWNIVFTTVTKSRLKGKITERGDDGETRSGTYESLSNPNPNFPLTSNGS